MKIYTWMGRVCVARDKEEARLKLCPGFEKPALFCLNEPLKALIVEELGTDAYRRHLEIAQTQVLKGLNDQIAELQEQLAGEIMEKQALKENAADDAKSLAQKSTALADARAAAEILKCRLAEQPVVAVERWVGELNELRGRAGELETLLAGSRGDLEEMTGRYNVADQKYQASRHREESLIDQCRTLNERLAAFEAAEKARQVREDEIADQMLKDAEGVLMKHPMEDLPAAPAVICADPRVDRPFAGVCEEVPAADQSDRGKGCPTSIGCGNPEGGPAAACILCVPEASPPPATQELPVLSRVRRGGAVLSAGSAAAREVLRVEWPAGTYADDIIAKMRDIPGVPTWALNKERLGIEAARIGVKRPDGFVKWPAKAPTVAPELAPQALAKPVAPIATVPAIAPVPAPVPVPVPVKEYTPARLPDEFKPGNRVSGLSPLAFRHGDRIMALKDEGNNPDQIAREINADMSSRNDWLNPRQVVAILTEMVAYERSLRGVT